MKDINGQELHEGDTAQLLCEITEITEQGVTIRVMNSDLSALVGAKHDEVLGGLVADSELTLFEPSPESPVPTIEADDSQADGVKAVAFE